ncbi:MAG TPA: alpha/beta hydrolase family protein [Pyrinomonadaceae bacterium]|nr:alpha/beta hydrolase family protein [Pyrinomonadaceae bacterium]
MNRNLRAFQIVVGLALIGALALLPKLAWGTFATSIPQTSTVASQNTRVQTIQFQSKLVGRVLPYNVLLPVDYNQPAAKDRRYPVLYLLHGLAGHYSNWIEKTHLNDYTAGSEIIVVMPEGNNSWYTDSATLPTEKYESYIIQELIPDVEKRFRASSERNNRAIAGLSMGGYGALKFGVKYPERFVLAASMSGALDPATWTESELKGLEFVFRTLQPVYGEPNSETRNANDIRKLYGALTPAQIASLPFVYVDCGTEDPLVSINRSFADLLKGKKIPYEYRELPGTHSWPYWDAQVLEVLRIANRKFGK